MSYDVLQWPATVYPGEVRHECPEAEPVIDALILQIRREGPSPSGYGVKTLGNKLGRLWQINLKVGQGRQVRILYAPYGQKVVLFRIHKKSSKSEQQRAYELAMERKREYEEAMRKVEISNRDGNRTTH
jgi:hypothetical protein